MLGSSGLSWLSTKENLNLVRRTQIEIVIGV